MTFREKVAQARARQKKGIKKSRDMRGEFYRSV